MIYPHKGKAFDKSIAIELIIEIFQGKQHIQKSVIENKISQKHRDRGGLPQNEEKHGNGRQLMLLML